MRAAFIPIATVPISQVYLNLAGEGGSGVLLKRTDELDWEMNSHLHTDKIDGTTVDIGKGTDGMDKIAEFNHGGVFEGEPGSLLAMLSGEGGSGILLKRTDELDWKEDDYLHTDKTDGTTVDIGKGTDGLDKIAEF